MENIVNSAFEKYKSRKLSKKALVYNEYIARITKLYNKNSFGCIYSMNEKKAKLEAQSIRLSLIGNGIFIFLIQTLLLSLCLLFRNYLNISGEMLESTFKGLLFIGIFFVVLLTIIYEIILNGYKRDRIKFEIQNKKLEELVSSTTKRRSTSHIK